MSDARDRHRLWPRCDETCALVAVGSIAGVLLVNALWTWHRLASGPDIVGDKLWGALTIAIACELPWVLGIMLLGKTRWP